MKKRLDRAKRALLWLWLGVAAVSCRAPATEGPSAARARNVILLVGDGLGAAQMSLGLAYARIIDERELHLERLMKDGNTGYALPLPFESIVTDSAAAATQMATGGYARNESIGLAPDGEPMETIVEWAEREGLRTGLVSNMRLSHATPASFASHQISRYDPESTILEEILLDHDIDVLFGGGARALIPAKASVNEFLPGIPDLLNGVSNRDDDRNLIDEARARGYRVVSDRSELATAAVENDAGKLLGLFSATHLPYVLDRKLFALEDVPTLAELTRAALTRLSSPDEGFFLLVEGGRIDFAGHDNDAGSLLHEVLAFDEALGEALSFQLEHPNTLVIVTADHGTGGFSFTYGDYGPRERTTLGSGLVYEPHHRYPTREHLLRLHRQTASFAAMVRMAGDRPDPKKLAAIVMEHTGLSMTLEEAKAAAARDENGHAWIEDFAPFYGDVESNPMCLLGRALARHTHAVWSTGGHTTEPALTFGRGPGAERLRGVYRNTHLHDVMKEQLERSRAREGLSDAVAARHR